MMHAVKPLSRNYLIQNPIVYMVMPIINAVLSPLVSITQIVIKFMGKNMIKKISLM